MPYVELALSSRFYDPTFIAKSNEKVTYYCEPACFEWIQSLGKENEIDKIQWMEIMLPFESLATRPIRKNYQPILGVEHLTDFPLQEQDTPYLVSIFNFFKALEKRRGKDETERLEFAVVSGSYPSIPQTLMERLVAFSLQEVIPKHERLRVMFSSRIRPFIKGEHLR